MKCDGSDFSITLLKSIKSGQLEIKENNKKTMQFLADKDTIRINLIDLSINIPNSQGIFARLSEAKKFAKELKNQNLTLLISHNNKTVIKLGKKAKPRLSRMVTSGAVEITDLRELRKLDKRLRLQ